jgi:multiple sugar transport system permease protein
MNRPLASRIASRVVIGAVLVVYGLISVYPFLWMVSGAFKTAREATASGSLWPSEFTLDGISQAWGNLHFETYFLNSISVTATTLVLVLVVYPAAGYAFSVLRFPFRNALFWVFVALLFVPSIVTLLPIILLQQQLGLLGTHIGLALVFASSTAPLAILLFRTIFDTVPKELREAARIDGANEFWIFVRVYAPLAKPAFATVGILSFVAVWNEYVVSGISLSDEGLYTLPIGLERISSANVVHWNEVMAGSLFLVIPVIILYLIGQRYFNAGVVGAIKG